MPGYRKLNDAKRWLGLLFIIAAFVLLVPGFTIGPGAGYTASAQSLTGAFGNNKRNRALPVRIEANLLVVLQKKKQAVFTGNVIATRGTVRIRSARLIIHYTEKGAGSAKSKTKIKRLNAYGKVVVTNGNKRATGQWAIMHMDSRKITMGDQVVVTENKTIIKGRRLELDLKSGKSRLFGSSKSSGRGRVLGIFVPEPAKR